MLVEMKTRHIFCRFYNEKVLGHSIHSAVVVLHGLLVTGRFNINHMIHIHIIYINAYIYIYIIITIIIIVIIVIIIIYYILLLYILYIEMLIYINIYI